MHYVDFDSKTKQTIMRFSIYIIIGIGAIIISILILFAARGYDVDPTTGSLIRNGLLLTWSQPESADVYVNDVLENSTPSRLPLPEGSYDLKISKEGYRDWTKTVKLGESEVVKLNYPRIFPNEINRTSIATVPSVNFWSQSPDQKVIVIQGNSNANQLTLFNAEDTAQPSRSLAIPESVLTPGPSSELEFVKWSGDSNFFLLKHSNGELVEFIRVGLENDEFININKQVELNKFNNVQFDRSENDKFYGISNGNLRLVDLDDNSVSEPIIGGVADYRVAGDGRIVVVQHKRTNTNVVVIDVDSRTNTILTGPNRDMAQIELGNFEGEHYAVVSISPNSAKILWLDEEDNRDSTAATLTGENIKVHPVSFTGRFALLRIGEQLITHDFDKLRVYKFKFDGLDQKTLSWFDDGHLSGVAGSKMIVYEFDGLNRTELVDSLNYNSYLAIDSENVFTLGLDNQKRINLFSSNLTPPTN